VLLISDFSSSRDEWILCISSIDISLVLATEAALCSSSCGARVEMDHRSSSVPVVV